MPVSVNVRLAGNDYARAVLNGMVRWAPAERQNPVPENPQNAVAVREREAGGLLTHVLQQICRDSDAAYVGHQLTNDLLSSKRMPQLDHTDEVDHGVGMQEMDDNWEVVESMSNKLKGSGDKESADVCARRTMVELENVTANDVRAAYADLIRNLPDNEKVAALQKALREDALDGTVRGKIAAAIKAQYRLMNELCDLCLMRGLVDKGLEAAVTRCGFCAQALIDLVVRIVCAPEGEAAAQGSSSASVAQSLVRLMMPKEERMKRELTETAVRILDEQLSGLQTLYNNLINHPRLATKNDFQQIADELKQAKKLLKNARGGIKMSDPQSGHSLVLVNLDKGLLRQLEERVDKMAVEVGRLRTDALSESLKALNDEIPCELVERLFTGKNRERFLNAVCGDGRGARARVASQINALVADFKALKGALSEVRKNGNATRACQIVTRMCQQSDGIEDLKAQIRDFCLSPRLSTASFKPRVTVAELERLVTRFDLIDKHRFEGFVAAINRMADMVKSVNDRHLPLVEGKLLAWVLDGRCGVATAALASAWKAKVSLLDPGIDDRNLVSSRTLGHGGVNTVTLCTYRMEDGRIEQRVFKPEIPAQFGWLKMEMEPGIRDLQYGSLQQVTMTNVVVGKVANELGIGDRVVRSRAGVHAGQYGLMMERAEGMSGGDIAIVSEKGNLENVMLGQKSLKDVKEILETDGEQAKTVIGNLCHAFVDLDWLDNIVGQTDRNNANYLISVGDDLSVTLKGIDNDKCLTPDRGDIRPFPPVISGVVYNHLHALVDQIEGLPDNEAWELLAGQLGTDDMPEEQGIAMVARLKAAWTHANSDKCTRIVDEDGWRDMDLLQTKFKDDLLLAKSPREADYAKAGLFAKEMLAANPFHLTGGPLAWAFPNEARDKVEKQVRIRRLQAVMNLQEQDLADRLSELPGAADVPIDEFKAHLAYLSANWDKAISAVSWDENPTDADILTGMLNSYRTARTHLVEVLEDVELQPQDLVEKRFLLRYYRNGCGDNSVKCDVFSYAVKTFNENWQDLQRVHDLLADNDDFDWMAFLFECQSRVPHIANADWFLFAEALVSELRNVNPNDLHVDRLLKRVCNKLTIRPETVLGAKVQLNEAQYDLFLKACARTPSGENYYRDVKIAYERNLRQGVET